MKALGLSPVGAGPFRQRQMTHNQGADREAYGEECEDNDSDKDYIGHLASRRAIRCRHNLSAQAHI